MFTNYFLQGQTLFNSKSLS